jgi:hypothetical protein
VLIRITSDISYTHMGSGNMAFVAINAVGAKPFCNLIQDGVVEKVEDMEYDVQKESWSEYKLQDGHTLMLKPSILQINRTGEIDATGTPSYYVQLQPIAKIKM